jgi:hypothetical protein
MPATAKRESWQVRPISVVGVSVVLVILIGATIACHILGYSDGASSFREVSVVWISGATGLFLGERSKVKE